jgi:hypothetical protein
MAESTFESDQEFIKANKITSEDPQAVKILGSKAVNSLRLTQLASSIS